MKVINGNNIDILKQFPDNHFDSIVTDPPYGLGKEPNAEKLMKDWIEKGYHEISGSGFMGKEWDAFVPQPIFWKEIFRVLKPGGHILSFFGTRTYDWGVMAMRFAGFEVRDCIQWLYGSGFPKSHNISKAIDKMYGAEREVIGSGKAGKGFNKIKGFGVNTTKSDEFTSEWEVTTANTEQAKQWDGWGSALKPAHEDIVLARKPLEKGLSIAENVLKWGVGAINIDGCRISLSNKDSKDNGRIINRNIREENDGWGMQDKKADIVEVLSSNGRFPANLILTHHPECECVGTKKVKGSKDGVRKASSEFGQNSGWNDHQNKDTIRKGISDENGEETIEDWNCHEDCPIKILDKQSGESKSSRFFYIAKASKSERNKGLKAFEEKNSASAEFRPNHLEKAQNGESGNPYGRWSQIKNFHPTVKPIKLMQYLVRLVTPPNGKVLDPFCGSGTTGVACKLEEFDFVGLEQDAEYCKIAQARIDNYIKDDKVSKSEKKESFDNDTQLNLF